jgi:hypothetical protein
MIELLRQLSGGDRRSVRGVANAVKQVTANPALFAALFSGMRDPNPLIRMRSADAVEKISAVHPEYLAPYKKRILELAAVAEQQEVRWHLAQLISRLALSARERRQVLKIMDAYLTDESRIVKTFAMQTLADIAAQDGALRTSIVAKLKNLTRTGSPAMKSRGRKLLALLSAGDHRRR